MSVTEEFLDKIRAIDGMKNAIVSNIEIYGRRKIVCFYLVTDLTYSQNVIPQAEQIAASFLPQGFSAAVKIEKKTPDETLLRQEIMRFMKSRFPAASAFLEERYIEVEKTEGGAIFRFVLAAGEQALFTADNILDEVAKHLRSTFCGSFFGDVRVTEKEREALEEEVIEEADAPKIRIFPIENYEKLDGADAAVPCASKNSALTSAKSSAAILTNLTANGAIMSFRRITILSIRSKNPILKRGRTRRTFTGGESFRTKVSWIL